MEDLIDVFLCNNVICSIDKNSVHDDTIFSLVIPKTKKSCKQIVVRKYKDCFPVFCTVNLPIATRHYMLEKPERALLKI